jgi:hypothetical protein
MLSALHMSQDHPQARECANCSARLHGRFCQDCGQKATGVHLGLHDVWHEALHEFAHVDGKILLTLKLLLFHPGALTQEFLRGRRARYVAPLRLYLTCSLLFFGLAALVPEAMQTVITVKASPSAASARTEDETTSEALAHRIGEGLIHDMPRVMFLMMPVFGLLTFALYRRQEPFYIPHLYYAVHFHAFIFLMLSVAVALTAVGSLPRQVVGIAPFLITPYHYLALRRVFGGSWRQVAWKGTVVGVVYWIAIAAVVAAEAYVAMRSVLGPS